MFSKTLMTLAILATAAAICPAQDCSSSCSATPASMTKEKMDIVDTAVSAGAFKTLVTAVKTAELVEALKGKGPFTVFAPTDTAFGKLPEGTVSTLLKKQNRARLTSILTWHVVPGRIPASQVIKGGYLSTLNGQRLPIKMAGDTVTVGGASVVKTDIECSNGIIHIIDGVMLPAEKNIAQIAQGAGTFNTLVAAAKQAGLVPALAGKGPLTVFAPTDAAFARLPAGTVESLLKPENKAKLVAILNYHVVSGRNYSDRLVKTGSATPLSGGHVEILVKNGKAKANEANIVKTDLEASNGVIHVIDQVLLPK